MSPLNSAAVIGRDNLNTTPSASDRYVQAPLTAGAVQRPKIHRQLAVFVGTVADTEDHHVAFVALDGLEVLDEHSVESVAGEVMLGARGARLAGDRARR